MAKVAIIGAGSIIFCKTLILDILATEGLEDTEFALMAPSRNRTPYVESFVKKVIEANDLPATVWVTTDQREAIRDADYVITTFQVGGVEGFEYDYKIPLKYAEYAGADFERDGVRVVEPVGEQRGRRFGARRADAAAAAAVIDEGTVMSGYELLGAAELLDGTRKATRDKAVVKKMVTTLKKKASAKLPRLAFVIPFASRT